MGTIQYHVVSCVGEYEDYHETLVYIFATKKEAIYKVKELYKEDGQYKVNLKKKYKKLTDELCKKYGVTATYEDEISEELSKLATEEEYDKYTDLQIDLMYDDCDNLHYHIYKYKIGKNGEVKNIENFYSIE